MAKDNGIAFNGDSNNHYCFKQENKVRGGEEEEGGGGGGNYRRLE